ncbi:MAG TPA: hypothetical protein VF023_07500 [Bryobacteraceae bacterium]|jgi:chromosome segregation ATPase
MAAAPVNLADQLKNKQKDLAHAEADMSASQSKAQSLRAEVQILTAAVAEYTKSTSDVNALADFNKANADTLASLKQTVGDAIKAKKDQIDKEIAAQEALVADKQKVADDAAAAAKKAQGDYDQAIADTKVADEDAGKIKSQIQDASKAISDVAALLKQADALYKAGNAAGAYFLLSEAEAIKVEVPAADKVTADLTDAQNRSIANKAKAAGLQPAAIKAKKDSDAAAQASSTATGGRRAAIVAALKAFN